MMFEFQNNSLWSAYVKKQSDCDRDKPLLRFYKSISKMLVRGETLDALFSENELNEIVIYGIGECGQLIVNAIKDQIKINTIIDKNSLLKEFSGIEICSLKEFAIKQEGKDNLPIIITPVGDNAEIIYELVRCGIEKKRIITINEILYIHERQYVNEKYKIKIKSILQNKNILLTGVFLDNIGSQAMLKRCMEELGNKNIFWILDTSGNKLIKEKIENNNVFVLNDGVSLKSQLFDTISLIDEMYDISGYVLSSNSRPERNERFILTLCIASYYQIPSILLPQSFGPLEFSQAENQIICEKMKIPKAVFVREKICQSILEEKYNLKNIIYADDIVIGDTSSELCYVKQRKDKSAILVPNKKLLDIISFEQLMDIYGCIEKILDNQGINISIVCYPTDKELGEKIRDSLKGKIEVKTINYYDKFADEMSKYNFGIVSRYHASVIGYKQNMPLIVLGWSEKYKYLTNMYMQNDMLFDIRDEINIENIKQKTQQIACSYERVSSEINKKKASIEAINPFEIIKGLN